MRRLMSSLVVITCAVGLAACSHMPGKSSKSGYKPAPYSQSEGGLTFGGGAGKGSAAAGAAIGVNSYLWRAALDTISFMPLASADPFGGVIITDWYANPEKPDERFKATVYILDSRLRADALKVAVHKQMRSGMGWSDSNVATTTEYDIENAILARARQLKLSGVSLTK